MSKTWGVIAVLFALVSGAALGSSWLTGGEAGGIKETGLARLVRTGVIRCGYIPFAPYFVIDPATGHKSGIGYEFMEALATELGVRVEWAEETGWGTFAQGLETNRYDALCTPVWESGSRARAALLTRGVYADNLYAYARADNPRFAVGLSAINETGVRVAVYDGDITQKVREMQFPLARDVAVPALTSEGEYLLNVVNRKADVVLVGSDAAERYNRTAMGKLKRVGDKPVRVFSNVMAVRHGEHDLKAALDSTLHALYKSGIAATIISKYAGQSPEVAAP